MFLRVLPPEVLVAEVAQFEANGSAAKEVSLPMQMILGQLPSGKVEMTLQELMPYIPSGYLKPTDTITGFFATAVVLPLMDVVMRIPPDLLALRPDQKEVDASVINMADPFTEEALREQAQAARAQSETNIIEESQAPQEEFVPRDKVGKSIAPPRRSGPEPVTMPPISTFPPAPMPPVAKTPTAPSPFVSPTPASATPPPVFSRPSVSPAAVPPAAPNLPEPTGKTGVLQQPISSVPKSRVETTALPPVLPPARSTIPLPNRPSATQPTSLPPPVAAMPPAAPVPPVPRHTGPIPAPPPPRHTTVLPSPSQIAPSGLTPVPTPEIEVPLADTVPLPAPPLPPTDDLQRLAALAMAQLGDDEAETEPGPEPEETSLPVEVSQDEPPIMAATKPLPRATTPIPQLTTPEFSLPVTAVAAPLSRAVTPVSHLSTGDLPSPPVAAQPLPPPPAAAATEPGAEAPVAFNLNTCTAEDLIQNIPGCSRELAGSIIAHGTEIGAFKAIDELLDVPGMTRLAYTELTGEAPPANRIGLSLNELLGFPFEMRVSLKDVTERITCWPDVTGCVLSQNNGLSLVGTTPKGVDMNAIVAFAPRMFDTLNRSFVEVAGKETDTLSIPTSETSFHLFRNQDLYLIIMSRLPQMPERHLKVARLVIAELSTRKD